MCDPSLDTTSRYADDVISAHRDLRYGNLLAAVGPDRFSHRITRGDGLTTVALATRDLPHRYLIGLQGFRFAQYLQLGWICRDVAYHRAAFCEPVHSVHDDDQHVLTLAPDGQILGYVTLATNGDERSWDLLDPRRARFPVELAHGINIFEHIPAEPGVTSLHVRELKRFVHARSMTDRVQRMRVSLELLYGLCHAAAAASTPVATLVGDVEERGALRHLLLAGLPVQIIEGTAPVVSEHDLLRHAYTNRDAVKPFVSHIDADMIADRTSMMAEMLSSQDLFRAAAAASAARPGALTRVRGASRAG